MRITVSGTRPRLDEVLLPAGELVANALQHTKSGQGGSFTVDVFHAGGRTAVSVIVLPTPVGVIRSPNAPCISEKRPSTPVGVRTRRGDRADELLVET
ncbi:MAG: hypothetical protein JWR24_4399 [Actinoallomurus sp.]|nr:hypothetical protein [Actinoallomurus sp.]